MTIGETASWGLWNEVFPDGGATLEAATDYAHRLSVTTGPNAVSTPKAQLYHDLHRHEAGASVADSKRLLDEAMRTAEYREGVAALRERRPPEF